jgi:hypothetical protein
MVLLLLLPLMVLVVVAAEPDRLHGDADAGAVRVVGATV